MACYGCYNVYNIAATDIWKQCLSVCLSVLNGLLYNPPHPKSTFPHSPPEPPLSSKIGALKFQNKPNIAILFRKSNYAKGSILLLFIWVAWVNTRIYSEAQAALQLPILLP